MTVRAKFKNLIRDRRYQNLSRTAVFTAIYEKQLWGEHGDGSFYSGGGSREQIAAPYCDYVNAYIQANAIATVIDIGCGDYRVGRRIRPLGKYIGLDVVPNLIAHHARTFSSQSTQFQLLDAVSEELPPGDLVLIRQVFQHLSNHEIRIVLGKLQNYKSVIVTEHFPGETSTFTPNKDKVHGPSTRVSFGSAVVLEREPFNINHVQEVLRFPAWPGSTGNTETIRTFLIERKPASV